MDGQALRNVRYSLYPPSKPLPTGDLPVFRLNKITHPDSLHRLTIRLVQFKGAEHGSCNLTEKWLGKIIDSRPWTAHFSLKGINQNRQFLIECSGITNKRSDRVCESLTISIP